MERPDIDTYREAVRISPDNVPLLLLFAKTCIEAWNFDEAHNTCQRILELQPGNGEAKLLIAGIVFKKGNTSEALVRIEEVLGNGPLPARATMLYSQALAANRQYAVARQRYEEAVAADPSLKDEAYESELSRQLERAPESTNDGTKQVSKVTQSGNEAGDDGADIDELLSSITGNDPKRAPVTFADVGGMERIKEEIRMKIIYPQKNADLFKAYGKKTGGGILLYGPPGCGKTHISRAIAGEIRANFFAIGIHQILDMYLGNSEKNLHEIFELARGCTPSVLFVDEIDALAADRSMLKYSAGRTLINQFLSEMDGIDADNDGILLIGATNSPWHLDTAFRRPGRFDRVLFVPPPDLEARAVILRILIQNTPVEGIDMEKIAGKTEAFSGADLKATIDVASEAVLGRAMKADRIIPLVTKDLLQAAGTIKPSTKAWFESAKNYALFSNQCGFYDDVLAYLRIKS